MSLMTVVLWCCTESLCLHEEEKVDAIMAIEMVIAAALPSLVAVLRRARLQPGPPSGGYRLPRTPLPPCHTRRHGANTLLVVQLFVLPAVVLAVMVPRVCLMLQLLWLMRSPMALTAKRDCAAVLLLLLLLLVLLVQLVLLMRQLLVLLVSS